MDDWTDLMYIGMFGCDLYGYDAFPDLCVSPQGHGYIAVLFFVTFQTLGALILLNLFIGVATTAMDEANNDAFYEDKLQALKDAILKRHGRLQEGDLALMHRLFKKLDYEREGGISFEDLEPLYDIMLSLHRDFTEATVVELFEQVDANSSGVLEFDEFVSFLVLSHDRLLSLAHAVHFAKPMVNQPGCSSPKGEPKGGEKRAPQLKAFEAVVRMRAQEYAARPSNSNSTVSASTGDDDQDGDDDEGGGSRREKKEKKSEKSKKSSREGGSSKSSSKSSTEERRARAGRIQVSQVKLLAEHCYSMTDDQIEEMVSAKIPTHSRWESYQEFKDKIGRRDELIRMLQDGLGTMNTERVKFQRACEDIELHHQDELQELKQHLAMALTSFQELQRASEHRESEMREAVKGANTRSDKFEGEKEALMSSMNDSRVAGAGALKEAEMLKESIERLNADIEKKTAEYEDARKRFSQVKEALTVERNLRARAEIKEEQMRQEIIATTGQMHAMRDKFVGDIEVDTKAVEERSAELNGKIDELEGDIQDQEQEMKEREEEEEKLSGEIEELENKLKSTSGKADKLAGLAEKAGQVDGLKLEVNRLEKEKADLEQHSKAECERLKALFKTQEEKLSEWDIERRKMHNQIQELRGNIRVYVRVRPFLGGDYRALGLDPDKDKDKISLVSAVDVKQDGATAEIRKVEEGEVVEAHKYSFDKSFPCPTTQDEIFLEVSEFVQSALDGYNVCLFSYGQTGSGKTHTMQGYGKGEMAGIIPKSISKIGKYRDDMKEKGWTYTMQITFIEIYNEQVFDLLRVEGSAKLDLPIKQDKKGKTYCDGVNKVEIDPSDDQAIDDLMDTAALHRATASTEMNAVSSRSHSIFSLYLTGANAELGATITGTLHLCDLAGSERVSRSGVEGDRLKEAININKSLSCLTDVFNGLGQKNAFIPFRNSKLTYFLQPALSGDGKTMMFVNLSPTNESYFESLCSLRFANAVNKVELGRASRNILEEPTETSGGAEAPKKGSKNKSTSPVPSKSPATGAKAKAGTGSKTKTGVKGKK
mmetsp:Transcript_71066/g.160805  ORF Transcript_71066/g.160805 Transcript_71066/m.160805 type:complete len:1051 (+) Transcript_71066:1-3153(+)